jgi:hypothetical protein
VKALSATKQTGSSSKIVAVRQGKLSHVKTFMAKKKKKREKKRSAAIRIRVKIKSHVSRPSKKKQQATSIHIHTYLLDKGNKSVVD